MVETEDDNGRRFGYIEDCLKEVKGDIEDHGNIINDINVTMAIQKTEIDAIKDTFVTIKNWVIVFVISNVFMYVLTQCSKYMNWLQ